MFSNSPNIDIAALGHTSECGNTVISAANCHHGVFRLPLTVTHRSPSASVRSTLDNPRRRSLGAPAVAWRSVPTRCDWPGHTGHGCHLQEMTASKKLQWTTGPPYRSAIPAVHLAVCQPVFSPTARPIFFILPKEALPGVREKRYGPKSHKFICGRRLSRSPPGLEGGQAQYIRVPKGGCGAAAISLGFAPSPCSLFHPALAFSVIVGGDGERSRTSFDTTTKIPINHGATKTQSLHYPPAEEVDASTPQVVKTPATPQKQRRARNTVDSPATATPAPEQDVVMDDAPSLVVQKRDGRQVQARNAGPRDGYPDLLDLHQAWECGQAIQRYMLIIKSLQIIAPVETAAEDRLPVSVPVARAVGVKRKADNADSDDEGSTFQPFGSSPAKKARV
ncbi:hypothetical protein C8F01DRAFT_1090631 [Mycena amicta]|nr:hypothetical protein C8F01DRAFT_1090631 [Mycena amicta]